MKHITQPAYRIAQWTRENGGGTFDLYGNVYNVSDDMSAYGSTEAYALSINPELQMVVGLEQFRADVVEQYIEKVFDHIMEHNMTYITNQYIGTWVHNNKVYLDVVTVVHHEDDAVSMAVGSGQLAYFDLTNNKEVVL